MRIQRQVHLLLVLLLLSFVAAPRQHAAAKTEAPAVAALDSMGLTVSDVDRSVDFFSRVLSFEKVSDREVYGSEHERLQGLFGMRARVVRMRLGGESIELTEYLTPKGRPIP